MKTVIGLYTFFGIIVFVFICGEYDIPDESLSIKSVDIIDQGFLVYPDLSIERLNGCMDDQCKLIAL